MLSWNPETLAVTLPIMLKGMVGIFVVLGIIALIVLAMGKMESGKKKK